MAALKCYLACHQICHLAHTPYKTNTLHVYVRLFAWACVHESDEGQAPCTFLWIPESTGDQMILISHDMYPSRVPHLFIVHLVFLLIVAGMLSGVKRWRWQLQLESSAQVEASTRVLRIAQKYHGWHENTKGARWGALDRDGGLWQCDGEGLVGSHLELSAVPGAVEGGEVHCLLG